MRAWRPRLAVPLLAGLAGLIGACADSAPRFEEVSLVSDGVDPAGPYRIAAWVRGGDGPRRVEARLTHGEPDTLAEGGCEEGGPHRAWRGVDAGGVEPGGCWRVPLMGRDSDLFTGDVFGAPFLPDTTVHYRLEASDADGDRALWPADGPARFVVRPPSLGLVALGPTEGPRSGGTEVALRGEGFTAGLEIWFGDRPAARVEVASGQLALVTSPAADAAGLVALRARTPFGEARLEQAFNYLAPPEVLRLAPAEGPTVEPTLVVVDGVGFQPGAVVRFGEVVGEETVVLDDARLVTVAPPHPPAAVAVQVENSDGQAGVLDPGFTWWPPPVIERVQPGEGPDLGGTPVRLLGHDMRPPATVWFDARPAEGVVVAADGRSATARTPAHPAGSVEVRLYNPDGQIAVAPAPWRFMGPPFVDAAEPPVLSRCGGGITTLVGENFDPAMEVRINGQPAEVIEVSADRTRARVRAPAGEPGPARVEVTNPDGRGHLRVDVLVYGVQPVVRAVEPERAPVWGGTTIRIRGADFEPGARVHVGEREAESARVVSAGCDGAIEAIVPAGAEGVVAVTVTNVDGVGGTAEEAVEYVAPRLEPPFGLVPGYANLRLVGVDLRAGLRVSFGDRAPRTLDRISDEAWRLTTPPGPRGPIALEVRNVDGRGVVLPEAFSYRIFVDETDDRLSPDGDCNDVSVADVDGDGDLDLVTASGALAGIGRVEQAPAVHLNDGRGRLRRQALAPAGNGMNAKLGDLDGDGDLDLFVANLSSPRSTYFRNEGGGRFAAVPRFAANAPAYDVALMDVEGDGDLDLLLLRTGSPESNATDGPEQLFLNDGRGGMRQAPDRVEFNLEDVHDHDVAHGDLDGDDRPDLVIVVDNISQAFAGARNRMLLNDGAGSFAVAASPFDRYPGDWLHAEIADVDQDGDLDVLLPQDYVEGLSRPGTPPLALFLNDGQARFEEASERIVGMPPLPAFESVVTDLDGDGDVDIVVAVFGLLFGDGSIEAFRSVILLNDGAGRFIESSDAFAEGLNLPSADFGPGDFDGDGATDLLECAARGQSRLWMQRE